MYVSYKEVSLFRGAFPYMFTITAAKNIVRYSKDFVRGSLKPRFHSSVINWSIHAWTYTVDAQKLSHSFFKMACLGGRVSSDNV